MPPFLSFCSMFCFIDKSSMYGQVSHTGEPNGTPDLSPGAANDENGEGAVLNRINDEFDEDDPFSKRRYHSSTSGVVIS